MKKPSAVKWTCNKCEKVFDTPEGAMQHLEFFGHEGHLSFTIQAQRSNGETAWSTIRWPEDKTGR